MEKSFTNFFKGLSVYTAVISAIGAILFLAFFEDQFLMVFPLVLIFFYLSTLLLHKLMLRILKSDASSFSFKFMMLSFLKMLVYIVLGVLYILIDEKNVVSFLIVYLILYILYSIFEVRSVMKLLNELQV